jgi:hypothetical protein
MLATLPGAADAASIKQQPPAAGMRSALPVGGVNDAAGATASSAAAAVAARRRQRKLLMQQQQQVKVAADAGAATQQADHHHQQQQQRFSCEMQDVEQQQHDKLSDSQLKPALQQLLQQMQEAHGSIQQPQYKQPQQHDLYQPLHQQQQLTAVAQLTEMIQNLQHPKQLLTVLLAGRGALNVVHYTSAAGVLVRMAQQSQRMQQDPTYRTKVSSNSW